ncbi:8834_t:CDS:2 [Funneliformis geosporum]|uniref:Glutamine synthetase n=1 Tax=Funneliformis geosporum TaxID=1117311 RepID=A0A9W4SMG5_9GLOM|nr:8834_t:CDS:2 [Funneliformis geosporum]CAI2174468.1 14643_t:CDS:2 [Funneliformis geosporum]
MNNKTKSPQTKEEVEKLLENDQRIKVAGVDVDGILRGKVIQKSKFLSILEDGFGFCSVIFGWDMHDKTYSEELEVSNQENGYADIIAKVDISTYRRIPWENNIPFFLLSFYDPVTKEPLYVCPRGLLKNIITKYDALGLKPMCGVEFEFFNFNETPETIAAKQHHLPEPLTQGMFGYSLIRPTSNQNYFYDLFDKMKEFGVDLEGLHTETGPGVYEAALSYSQAMDMADSATLFKLATKQIGILRGVMPCFMAKPHNDLPGCSGHVHFSLKYKNTEENAFAKKYSEVDDLVENGSNLSDKEWKDTKAMSDLMKQFLAGILVGLPSIMPLLAPNVNSYKRLVENYWAPVSVSWGLENRTAAIRIISPPTSSASATRIELRVPGADINPYFTIAATLACGLYGIENKLPVPIPPLSYINNKVGISQEDKMNLFAQNQLSKSLKEATLVMMAKDSIARKVLGDKFIDHFGKSRLHEWKLWETTVTNWETKRYFETV